MKEVKDEILSGEVLYRIIDKNGNILFDDLKIELKTLVKQIGTYINKLLFDSIREHLLAISTYHPLKGADYSNYTSPSLTNTDRKGYTATQSYYCVATYFPESAYDMLGGDGSKYAVISGPTHSDGRELFYQLNITAPTYIKLSKLTHGSGDKASHLLVKASNDNSNFETIYDGNGQASAGITTHTINSEKFYKYFIIKFTNTSTSSPVNVKNNIYLYGISISSINVTEKMAYSMSEKLSKGQILHFETSDDYQVGNNINYNLQVTSVDGSVVQTVKLPTDLPANSRVKLVYSESNGLEIDWGEN